MMVIDLVIVTRGESAVPGADATLARILAALPRPRVREVQIVDAESGYGAACAEAVAQLSAAERPPDVVVFLDAEDAADPSEIELVVDPIESGRAEFVVGSRVMAGLGRELGVWRRLGIALCVRVIRALYNQRYTDVGPLRAIRLPALVSLGVRDRGAGWRVEMQVRAARARLRIEEVPAVSGSGLRTPTARETTAAILSAARTLARYATSA
jgi:Glycosyl transferase family 2